MRGAATRWLLLALALASCTRSRRQPDLWRAPHVGDRGTGSTHYTATLRAPDGSELKLDNYSEYASESLAVDGEYPTRMRMTFVRDEHNVNGIAKSGLTGTYEITDDGDGSLAITRTDGPVSEEARKAIEGSHHQTRKTVAAAKALLQRTFKVGEGFDLTPDEVAGLGFGMSKVRLTPREVTPSHVSFQMDNVAELSGVGTLKATGTLRITPTGRDLQQDGEVVVGGKQIGTVLIVQHAESQPR